MWFEEFTAEFNLRYRGFRYSRCLRSENNYRLIECPKYLYKKSVGTRSPLFDFKTMGGIRSYRAYV